MNQIQQPTQQPESFTTRRRVERRSSDVRSDVLVPLLLAVVSGTMAAIVAAVIWYSIDVAPVEIIPLAFGVTVIAVWLWRMRRHDELLYAVEELTQNDLNRDGTIGRPTQQLEAKTYHTTIEIMAKKENDTPVFIRKLELPIGDAVFAQFARAALAGHSLTERSWTGDGKPMSTDQYRMMKLKLLNHNILKWGTVNGKRTVVITEQGDNRDVAGRKVLEDFLAEFEKGQPDDDN